MLVRLFCNKVTIVLLAVFSCFQFLSLSPVGAQGETVVDYRGYHIVCQPGGAIDPQLKACVEQQIDICEAAPVPAYMRAFFKKVPVTLDITPAGSKISSRYSGIAKDDKYGHVDLQSEAIREHKPILLHEYLHGVHGKLLEDGFKNAAIEQFYQRGLVRLAGLGQAKAGSEYFLSNSREFFAVTASIYLFGDIVRPPFSMRNISRGMPVYSEYLQKLFAVEKPIRDEDR